MDVIRALADYSIRRACGFAGLGIGVTMISLSFDLPLAFRCGAALTAVLCLGLAAWAWRVPRHDMRRTELWTLLADVAADMARGLPRPQAQRLLSEALRERLLWHADLAGAIAVALWAAAFVAALASGAL